MSSSGSSNLRLQAVFFNPDIGDRVKFTYNGADCQGEITQQILDGSGTYAVRVVYCNNWPALGEQSEVKLALSAMSPISAPNWPS